VDLSLAVAAFHPAIERLLLDGAEPRETVLENIEE